MSDLDVLTKLPSLLFQAESLRLPLRSDIREVPLPLEAAVRVAAQSTDAGFVMRKLARPKAIPGVAEGDSWFDYLPSYFEDPIHGDLLGHLNVRGKVNVFKIAKAGDTLENMVYGTEVDDHFREEPPQIRKTLEAIKRHKARFFLFSAGGNDIAGLELEAYLNHQGNSESPSGLPAMREKHADHVFGTVFPQTFGDVIRRVKSVAPDIHIFLHGYGYAIPDGRSVISTPNGWHFVGPWLLPALARKRVPAREHRAIIKNLIDRLNDTLAAVAAAHSNVHYIDLRPIVQDGDWVNELHLSSAAFG